MDAPSHPVNGTEVADRADLPQGFLGTAWPIAALALMLLLLLRACVPAPPTAPAPPPSTFDSAAAAARANKDALEALEALPAQPELPQALAALNGLVINFASGSDAVPADAAELLRAAAAVIAALPAETRILIVGHTDNVGDPAANLVLSRRRAQAVRNVVIGHGVPAARVVAQGVGDSRPVAGNDTEAGRFRNRRIEFSAAP